MPRKYVTILGVRVDSTEVSSLLKKIETYIRSGKKFYVVTPNPEQVVLAQKDKKFAEILNKADISLCDGIGLIASYKFLSLPKGKSFLQSFLLYLVQALGVTFSIFFDPKWLTGELKLIKGRKIFIELVGLADKRRWKVYFLGGRKKVSQRTKVALEKEYKNINIRAGTGPSLNNDGTPVNLKEAKKEESILKDINTFNPQLLFVGFGAPKQEKWIVRHFRKLDVGGIIVVGGTFNYFSGEVKLPPNFIDRLGLEWLWRLFTGSQKLERVSNAVFLFPYLIFKNKLNLKNGN